MARGIEELAEMQVTGPVQGGDMVMKPDQTPVGAAALLNKMSRQNTPGIFKLPMPDKQMPDFMKVAAEGVEQQTAKGDTINQMAGALLRQGVNIQGMGMDEIIQIYEQTFGSPGDVDEFGVSQVAPDDWRTILKMIQSGMSEEEIEAQMAATKFPGNFTQEKQNIVELPRNLKTAPDAEETKLAYITDDEKAILALMNPGTPHEGPEGVPSYDSQDYGVYTSSEDWAAFDTGTGSAPAAHTAAVKEAAKDTSSPYHDQAVAEKNIIDTYGDTYKDFNQAAKDQVAGTFDPATGAKTTDSNMLNKALTGSLIFKGADALSGTFANLEEKWVDDLISKLGTDKAATGTANLLYDFKHDRKDFKKWFKDWGDKLEDPSKDNEWADMEDEEKLEELIAMASAGGGDEFQKNYNPDEYYGTNWTKDTKRATTEDLRRKLLKEDKYDPKHMAELQAQGKLEFTKANTAMIEEGRRLLEEDRKSGRGDQDRHPGTGIPVEQVTEEEEVATTTTDPRAGAFGVGGTMPYTEDIRTAGVEMDVPLGGRFGIDKTGKYRGTTGGMDLSKAMDYATLGGHGQLEPFQEYLTRRRKYLGEDEPRYFDEEGNVIYSDSETV